MGLRWILDSISICLLSDRNTMIKVGPISVKSLGPRDLTLIIRGTLYVFVLLTTGQEGHNFIFVSSILYDPFSPSSLKVLYPYVYQYKYTVYNSKWFNGFILNRNHQSIFFLDKLVLLKLHIVRPQLSLYIISIGFLLNSQYLHWKRQVLIAVKYMKFCSTTIA